MYFNDLNNNDKTLTIILLFTLQLTESNKQEALEIYGDSKKQVTAFWKKVFKRIVIESVKFWFCLNKMYGVCWIVVEFVELCI